MDRKVTEVVTRTRAELRGSVSGLSGVIGGSSKPGNADCFSLFLFIGTLAGPMCSVQVDLYIYMVIHSL